MLDKEIWLVGKGPSLDAFKWENAGPCRVGINETPYLIPDCYAAIGMDRGILEKYKNGFKIGKIKYPPIDNLDVLVFRKDKHKYSFKKEYVWSKEKEVQEIKSTAYTFLQIAEYFNVETVHLVGFDALAKTDLDRQMDDTIPNLPDKNIWAKSVLKIEAKGRNTDRYRVLSLEILDLLKRLKLKCYIKGKLVS